MQPTSNPVHQWPQDLPELYNNVPDSDQVGGKEVNEVREYPIQLADKTGLVCIDPRQLSGGQCTCAAIFIGAGQFRSIAAYNQLLRAVEALGGGVVRWNGQQREVAG